MDILDRRIIALLQKDPRQSNRRLAQYLNIDEHTIKKRIENLVSSGTVILTVLPNLKQLGYSFRVFMLLDVDHSKFEEVGKQLCQMPEIGFVGYCIGFTKFYVRGDFTSTHSLSQFSREKLGGVQGIKCI